MLHSPQILALRRRLVSSAFDPAGLFANGENGEFWNIAKAQAENKLWKESNRSTNATAADDPLGAVDGYVNGNHLLQATSGKRPLLKNSGALWWALTDGTDDYLQAAFTLGVPYTNILAVAQDDWTGNDRVWDIQSGSGFAATTQTVSSPKIGFNNGVVVELPIGEPHVVTQIADSVAGLGKLAVDNGSYQSGTLGISSADGFTLGAARGGTQLSQVRFYGSITINRVLTDDEIAACRTYFGALVGLSL